MDTLNLPVALTKNGVNVGSIDSHDKEYLKLLTDMQHIHIDNSQGTVVVVIDTSDGTIHCKNVVTSYGTINELLIIMNGRIDALQAEVKALQQQVPFHAHQFNGSASSPDGPIDFGGITGGPIAP
jgi:hypothetical protein